MLQSRNITIRSLFLNTISQSAVVQLGDHANAQLKSRAIAVQRAIPDSVADEFRFASYPIFFRDPLVLKPCRPLQFQTLHTASGIRVGTIESLGVSSSSYLRAGTGGTLSAVSRVKHIRQFNNLVR